MKLVRVDIDDLKDHPENPRTQFRDEIVERIANELSAIGEYPKEHAIKVYQTEIGHNQLVQCL